MEIIPDIMPCMANTKKLFFYGTLKRNQCRSHVLNGQKFLGEALTTPNHAMYSVHGSYPALIEKEGGVSIEGELWEVDEKCLRTLDAIEGVPTLYDRKQIQLSSHPDDVVESYFYQNSVKGLKDCGVCWK